MSSPDLLISGTGATASLFAARLSAAGIRTAVTGTWVEGLDALESRGVVLVSEDGSEQSFPVQVYRPGSACPEVRCALVLVKAWQTAQAACRIERCLAADGIALTLQNGLGNREELVKVLGETRVGVGSSTCGAHLLGPGRVKPAGEGVIYLGRSERLLPLTEMLRAAGFAVEEVSDLEGLLWGKLVINAAINPLTALLEVANGELLERPAARRLLRQAAEEAARVAAAKGIHLPYADPAAAAENVARRTAANRSSMLQDVARGAPTEIDAICGIIVREGEKAGVPTPINDVLWNLVKAKSKP
jgi:2-dehydropantoate 2-reductase